MKAAPSVVVVAVAAALATSSEAAEDRWTAGFGQGVVEASITGRRGVTFSVVCPASSETALPGFSLEVPGLRGGRPDEVVGVVFTIDGRNYFLVFRNRVLDQGQSVLVWESRAAGVHPQMVEVLNALRVGRRFRVNVPRFDLRPDFSLVGAREALADCPTTNG